MARKGKKRLVASNRPPYYKETKDGSNNDVFRTQVGVLYSIFD